MSKLSRFSLVAMLIAMVFGVAAVASPARAAGTTFDIVVKHNINGASLGLAQELPVDVYVNGDKVFTFEFGDTFSTSLPADTYAIDVKLAGTNTTVMSLGPTEIPADVTVVIKAKLSAGKTPVLKVNVK